MNRYANYEIQPPTVPIPFCKFLKVVAVVDPANAQTKELLAQIASDNYEVEVSEHLDRDVAEDASVGAYIVLTDGERLEPAKTLLRAVRGRRLSHAAVGAGRFAPHQRPAGGRWA